MASISGTAQQLIDSSAAAQLLGVTPSQVLWLARQGRLQHIRRHEGGRLWFEKAVVEREAHLRAEAAGRWISYEEAAKMAGCSRGRIGAAARRGEIATRPARSASRGPRGGRASLEVESVRAFAERWAMQQQEATARAAERAKRRLATDPPDQEQVWLTVEVTALVLGLSASRVKQLAAADRLPHARTGLRIWFRRQDVEQVAAARAFTRAHRRATLGAREGSPRGG